MKEIMGVKMTREQLNKVFDWLEENINKSGWLEFKVTADNNITAYIEGNKNTFANFYTKQILKVINNEWNECMIGDVNNEKEN